MFVNRYQIISILLLLFVGLFLFFDWSGEIKQVIIGEKTFFVEVARTKMELERGLSLHIPLLDNQGMLFVFPKEDIHRFWMKDMTFLILSQSRQYQLKKSYPSSKSDVYLPLERQKAFLDYPKVECEATILSPIPFLFWPLQQKKFFLR